MTVRDYFAAKAMIIGYKYWTEIFYPLVDPDGDDHPFGTNRDNLVVHIAEESYMIADAMLIARGNSDQDAYAEILAALEAVAGEVTDGVRPTSADSHLPADIVRLVHSAIAKATGKAES